MSKNLNKSGSNAGGTPKNTLFNYFAKSPAMQDKKKIPKTPVQNADTVEKENVASDCNSPKSLPKRSTGPRNLDVELQETLIGDVPENNNKNAKNAGHEKNEDDEVIIASQQMKKRRRVVIHDTDSSEDENIASKQQKKSKKNDDDEYRVSSEMEDDDDDEHNSSNNSCSSDGAKQSVKRKSEDDQTKKKPKLDMSMNKKETIQQKLQAFQDSAAEQHIAKDSKMKDKYDKMLATSNDANYDEPVIWPHQKLEFLKPEKIKDKQGRRPDHPDYDASTLYVPVSFLDGLSPGVRQWWILKSDNFDCVLFFKVGKFYELYHMDADVGVNELGFNYMRGEFAHSGFPEIAFDKMAPILVDRGYKVARIEQTETPDMMTERCKKIKATKFDKVVRREICQITNRGTQVFGSQSQVTLNHQPSYMLALAEKNDGASSAYGIAYIDTSIGDFYVGEFVDDRNCSRLLTLLSHHMPALLVFERGSLSERTQQILRTMLMNVLKEQLPNIESQRATAEKTLKHLAENYYALTGSEDNWPVVLRSMQDPDDNLGLTPHASYHLALKAVGICLNYMRRCHLEEKVMPMVRFHFYTPPDATNDLEDVAPLVEKPQKIQQASMMKHMVLDATTLTHLRITGEDHSLLSTIDQCCTKFGKRLLHHWLCAPSCDCYLIAERQEAISEFLANNDVLQEMRALFAPLPDFERQLAQIHLFGNKVVAEKHPDGRAILFEEKQYNKKKLKNFIAILKGFDKLQDSIPSMFGDFKSPLIRRLTQNPTAAAGVYPDMSAPLHFFETSFNHTAAAETGVIAPEKGIDADYDAAESKIAAVQSKLQSYLSEQEQYFGCRLNYFGADKKRFQIEVPEKRASKANAEYQLEGQRKGSNPVRRFTTNRTRELLKEMMNCEDERNRVVKDLARRVFEKFSNHYAIWKQCVDCIAYLDVLGSLAEYARQQLTICVPIVLPSAAQPYIDIQTGYHPCMSSDTYIPNSITLGTKGMAPLSLLSGPNMGGKSTFMRQVGLLLVMAQIGAHVPAEHCEFTMIDRIFSRIGAQDDILAGQSTFMVEMNEASLILKHATRHSFVLMDELGRGTATYDGTAIAASVVKYLAELGCRAMFSTHYKNLTDNFGKDKRIQLGHMACMVENEDTEDPTEETVTFLYKYTGGACPKSYGFNAAKLAGMPHDIIKRAYELSKEVEAIALKRKIAAKMIGAATGKSLDNANVKVVKNLLEQLKLCQT